MAKPAETVAERGAVVRELSVPAEEGQLSRVRDFVAEVCEEAGFTPRETNNTKLAVDEACTNIIKHAYGKKAGGIDIRASLLDGKVEFALLDEGEHFDFASVQDPDLDQYVETGRKGGLGVFLINRLMDGVEYRTGAAGNELVLTKSSRGFAHAMPGQISWRGSLRYKFTMRASIGFFILIAAIGVFTFARQTNTLREHQTTQWLEKRRLAESLASKSKELLLSPETYSVEQTTLTAFVNKMLEGNEDLVYARVVDATGQIMASGDIDEMFTNYNPPMGEVMLQEDNHATWTHLILGNRSIRDINVPVRVVHQGNGRSVTVGNVYLGVDESLLDGQIKDPRIMTMLIIVAVFLIGILLIMGLVSVFVKPIQVLTDGVRAIGQGSLDGKISVEGPAEIGAIASVFNEITDKFKKAQASVLEQEKLQKEIEVAKQIQQALLPKKHPDVSGYDIAPYYQAAKEVGGDYYDFVSVDNDTLGVVVADVSGKGVPGSLVMTMIRTALRMEARGNKNASDVMSKMNDFVTDDMKKGMFVTMFYVILDSKNRVISYASAGHNPMILYRADSNDTFFLNPKGFPVGISLPDEELFRKSISLEKIKLKKDDMLLIYTDGVTEAMNEKREQYGEDRLVRIVREHGRRHPKEFIKILEGDIKTFTGGHPQNDDITVVAVKEKLAADDVLFGIRKKLIDLVDLEGLSVKEACARMKVSPATYYRYKKRMATMGERGLRNKVLRQDIDLKRASIEERKRIIDIIRQHPEYGAKRIAQEYNSAFPKARELNEKIVYDELKRMNLNTKEMRIDYLKRNRLIEGEGPSRKTSKEMVEELLGEVAAGDPENADEADIAEEAHGMEMARGLLDDSDSLSDIKITQSDTPEGISVLTVDGHLDSVSSTALERKLKSVISASIHKIIVDLRDVTYISSGGWGIFVGEVRRLREQSGDVVLVGMSAEVYDVYELLGFNDILRAFNTTDEALVYLNKPVEERFKAVQKSAYPEETLPSRGESLVDEVQRETYGGEWESLLIEAATVGETSDMAVISLKGIIDTISAEHLRAAIDKVVRSGIYKIVIDMSLVEYVSSGGWGTFTERLRELRRNDGDLKLFGMDPDVYYVFTMLGFNIVLSSFDIMSEALEDFKRSAGSRPSVHPGNRRAAQEEVEAPVIDFSDDDDDVEELTGDVFATRISTGEAPKSRQVDWLDHDGISIGRIRGMIEASTVDRIDHDIRTLLEAKPLYVVFDLSKVEYVSSTGWGLFAKYHQQVQEWNGSIALCGMSPELHDIFSCLEFYSFIPSYATLDEALGSQPRGKHTKSEPEVRWSPPPAVEEVRGDEPGVVEEILDLEEIAEPIDDDTELTGWPAEPPTEKEREDWPSEPEPEGETREPSLDESPPKTQPSPHSYADDEFVDVGEDPNQVDIDGSVTGGHVDDDKKLRNEGWGAYGERLKKKMKRKKDDGDEE